MTNRDLARLAFFLLGILWLPKVIGGLMEIATLWSNPVPNVEVPPSAWILYGLSTGLALSLLVVPGWWARWVFRREGPLVEEGGFSPSSRAFCIALAGLILLCLTVPEILGIVFDLLESVRGDEREVVGLPARSQPLTLGQQIALGARFLAGLLLILGSHRVVAWLDRSREDSAAA